MLLTVGENDSTVVRHGSIGVGEIIVSCVFAMKLEVLSTMQEDYISQPPTPSPARLVVEDSLFRLVAETESEPQVESVLKI